MRGQVLEDRGRAQGFTLVELMVVVAIVAILAALAVPALRTSNEDEFDRAVRTLSLDVMAAKSLSLSRREDHSIIVTGPGRYLMQAVWPNTTTYIDPPERNVTLPASTKIVLIKQCTDDFGPGAGACSSAASGSAAELRFVGTGELASCFGDPMTCTRTLKSMTLYLEGSDNKGNVRWKRRIVVYSSTGFVKVVQQP